MLLQSSAGSKVSRPDPEAARGAAVPPCLPCHGDASSRRCVSLGEFSYLSRCARQGVFLERLTLPWRPGMAGGSAARREDEIISQLGSERNSWHPAHDGNTRCPIDSGMLGFFL